MGYTIKTALLGFVSSVVVLASQVQAEQQFSNIYTFGDSLSDVGNVSLVNTPPLNLPVDAPLAGRNWAMAFAERYGIILRPTNVVNTPGTFLTPIGTDFAWAGTMMTGPRVGTIYQAFPSVPQQVDNYFNTIQRVDSRALFTIWAGSNDISNYFTSGFTNPLTLEGIGNEAVNQLNRLHGAGAKYLMIMNLPDVGRTPFANFANLSAPVSQAVFEANTHFNSVVGALPYNVIQIDIYSMANYILDHPEQFGLTNTTIPGIFANPSNGNVPGFFFFDDIHPTETVSQMLGNAIFSIVQAPLYIGMVGEAAYQQMGAYEQAINSTLHAFKREGCKDMGITPIISYSYEYFRKAKRGSVSPGFYTHDNHFMIGLNSCVFPFLNLGFVIGQSISKNKFIKNKDFFDGKFDENQTRGVLFVTLKKGPAFMRADVHGSYIHVPHTKRNIPLGPSISSARGKTKGHIVSTHVEAGFWLTQSSLLSGPIIQFDYQNGVIKGFKEHGAIPGTNMRFWRQKLESIAGGFGWEAIYSMGDITPWGRAMVMFEKRPKRHVGARVGTLSGTRFEMPIRETSARPWAYLELNVDRKLTKRMSVSAGLAANIFKKVQKANAHTLSATVRMTF